MAHKTSIEVLDEIRAKLDAKIDELSNARRIAAKGTNLEGDISVSKVCRINLVLEYNYKIDGLLMAYHILCETRPYKKGD